MPRPLFVLGSKRSGSTLTVHLLNSHPEVFVSHESDIAWLLTQARHGPPPRYEPHPLDSDMMLRQTVRLGRRTLARTLGDGPPDTDAMRSAFFGVQRRRMERWIRGQRRPGGGLWRVFEEVGKRPTLARLWRALRKPREVLDKRFDDLAWIGDKKHIQMVDPDVRAVLTEHFPDARSLHVVRDPRGVVASMQKADDEWFVKPDFFSDDATTLLEQWALVEERVAEMQATEAAPILTVRMEDLWADPAAEMTRVFAFLDLEMHPEVERRIPLLVRQTDPNRKYADVELPEVPRARAVMERLGYAA